MSFTRSIPRHCVSISLLPSPSSPPTFRTCVAFFAISPCVEGSAALGEGTPSLRAVVYLRQRLNEKGPVGCSAPLLIPGRLQRPKVLPSSSVCSAGGLEATEADDQILFTIPSLAGSFQAGFKNVALLASDLGAASAGSPDLFLTRRRHEERHEETTNRGQRRKDE